MAKVKAKITKLMIWPSRKLNLGNYNTADLNAGIEMTFEKPVEADSPEVKETLDEMRRIVKEEFTRQYEPYKHIFEKKKSE